MCEKFQNGIGSHRSTYFEIIKKSVQERLVYRVPDFHSPDSTPVKKLAVRLYMEENGDEYCYSRIVPFRLFSMKETAYS